MKTGFLGIDVGLSGTRAAVISAKGQVLTHARLAADTSRLSLTRLSALVDRTVRMALADRPNVSIAGVCICAFGPAPILLDDRGRVVAQLALFDTADSAQGDDGGDDLRQRFSVFRHKAPKLFARVRMVCDVTGYLVYRLTGRLTMDHVTAADYLQIRLPKRVALPDRQNADAHAGPLGVAAARRLGLPAGTPVAVGAYDSTADLVAAGFGQSCKSVVVLGTTMVLGVHTERPVADPRLRSTPHVGKGWFSGGWTNCAGATLTVADQLLAQGPATREFEVPMVWPYLAGERAPVWSPQATGLVAGLTTRTTATGLRHGFIRSIALSAADIAERLSSEFGAPRQWTVTGGGSRNTVLMSELADALGATLRVVRGADANLGPAVLAARSCGVKLSLPAARSYRANRGGHRAYGERLRVYRQVFEALRPLMPDIARVTQQEKVTV